MLARDTMSRAQVILQDDAGVRWPLPELAGWLNDGMREIAKQMPAAFSSTVDVVLVAGAKQGLAFGYTRMLRPIANAAFVGASTAPRVSVTVIDRGLLDAVIPDWQNDRRQHEQVRHVMFDEVTPRTFYVYPPNNGTGRLAAVLAAKFTPVAATGSVDVLSSYAAEIALDDLYANALLDYVLYRAYSKDAQFVGSAQRAALHFGQFANAVNMQVGADATMSPNRKPGVPAAPPGVAAGA